MKVLYVEDDVRDADLTRRELARIAPQFDLEVVATLYEAQARISEGAGIDVVLASIDLPDGNGVEWLERVRQQELAPAMLAITENDSREVAIAALRAGADDCIVKRGDYLARLPQALAAALDRHPQKAITRRKFAEASLRDSERRYRTLFEQAGVGVAEMDRASGRFMAVNRKLADIVGYEPAEMLQLTFQEISYPDDMPANIVLREQLLRGEISDFSMDKRYVRKDGSIVWVHLNVSPIWESDGTCTRNISVVKDITERKRVEAALLESEARYRSIYENIQDVYLESTIDGTLIEVSPQISILSGGQYRREDLLGKSAVGFYASPEQRTALLRALMEQGSVRDFETVVRNRDGTLIPVSVSGRLVLDGRERSQRLVVTLRDVTERKRTEDALKLLTTNAAHLRGDVFYEYLSDQLARLLGVAVGFVAKVIGPNNGRVRFIGLSVNGKIMPPVDFDLAGTPCDDALGKGVTVVLDSVREVFPSAQILADLNASGYAAVALHDSKGRIMGNVGVMSRGTLREPGQVESILRLFAVRIATEMERETAERRFQDLFEYAPDGNIIVDQSGVITMVNRQAEAIFGYSREELIDKSIESLIPQADRPGHDKLRQGYVRNPGTRTMGAARGNLHALRKDGSVFPVDISLNPLHSDDGMHVVAAVRDISSRVEAQEQRKALEAQLFQAQKMEAVGTLAGGIAHDFNNILSAIIGNVVLAREDVGANHPVLRSLEEILVASRRARDLVSQILAFSRQQSDSRKAMELRPMVEEVVALLSASLPAGVEIDMTHSAAVPRVIADSTQMHQILMNLCTNAVHAIKARSDGLGRIHIEVDGVLQDERATAIHADFKPGRYARLTVRDSGTGMEEETRKRVFEPFFTTKGVGQGTGLGLSVVHGIVRSHGGVITVDSKPGVGTEFSLYFPAAEIQADPEAAQPVPISPRHGRGQNVLYLDDDDSLVFLVKRALVRKGYRVVGHTDSAEALQALRADPAQFDLVLTDYNMPGMSGLEFAREVLHINPRLPVAVITGYITDALREEAPAAGIRELIYKPNSAEELCETVQRLLDQQG